MKTPNCSDPVNAPAGPGAIWLCLYFASLPLEVFTRSEAEGPESKPIVVHARQRVMFLNSAAREAGIQTGNSVDTAFTLNGQLTSLERDPNKETQALDQLANWCYQFTPTVCIKTENSLLLEVAGCLRLFEGLHKLNALIRKGLGELGYQCQTANAPTPLSALLLAKAANLSQPPQLTREIPAQPDPIAAIIQHVPVSCMEVDKKIIHSLHNMGILHMGNLLALPASSLGKRFGQMFADYLDRLMGRKADPQQTITPASDFFGELHFLTDVVNSQSLIFPMQRLLTELGDFLTSRQLVIDRFSWHFKHKSHPPKTMVVCIAGPDNNQKMFLALTRLQLERFSNIPEIDSLALSATEFSAVQQQSDDLFRKHHIDLQTNQQRLTAPSPEGKLLLNMLRARLGPQTCFGLSLADDHRPEKAWKLVQLSQQDYWPLQFNIPDNPRPAYLLKAPRPLSARSLESAALSHSKAARQHGQKAFHFLLKTYPLNMELLQGPEKIDCGWWDEDDPRDYFIARHDSGSVVWVFRQLKSNNWYLHGIFS